MAIKFNCTCGAQLSVKDDLAGRKGKCPTCGATMSIPAASAPAAVRMPMAAPQKRAPTRVNPFEFAGSSEAPAPAESQTALEDEPLRLKETPPLSQPDPLALQAAPSSELAEKQAPAAPRAAAAKAPQPHLFLENAKAPVGLYEFRYLALGLALLPLLFSLFSQHDNVGERFRQTLSHVSPEMQKKIESLESNPNAKLDDLLALFPNDRIEGAHLARNTWVHWIYAALSAAAFVSLILLLFPRGNAEMAELIKVGLFTGTIGIIFLLAVQWIAAFSSVIGVRNLGKLTFIIWAIQFIGFSYRCALDPSNGFLLSFIGFTCGVGLCEELCKGWPVMRHFMNKAKLDWQGACVWGLASGVGFGVSEGITYSSDYYNGITGIDIYIIRFVSCVSLHAIWGGSVGIGMFRRQYTYQGGLSIYELALPIVRVLSVPMVLHGLYDTLLKKELPGWAFLVALASFAFLAYQIEQMRREENANDATIPQTA